MVKSKAADASKQLQEFTVSGKHSYVAPDAYTIFFEGKVFFAGIRQPGAKTAGGCPGRVYTRKAQPGAAIRARDPQLMPLHSSMIWQFFSCATLCCMAPGLAGLLCDLKLLSPGSCSRDSGIIMTNSQEVCATKPSPLEPAAVLMSKATPVKRRHFLRPFETQNGHCGANMVTGLSHSKANSLPQIKCSIHSLDHAAQITL